MTNKSKISQEELAEQFRVFIDPEYVITDDETMKPYECDGMSMYCEMPLLVLLPETVTQVQRVMRICHEHGVPVVARGAGTGSAPEPCRIKKAWCFRWPSSIAF